MFLKDVNKHQPGSLFILTQGIFFTLIIFLSAQSANAQTSDTTATISDTCATETVLPVFQGDYALFLIQNIKYPKKAIRNRIHGRVIVEYILEIDGSITNVVLLQGIGYGCDEEAIRVVKLMSTKWYPGTNSQGVPVRYKTMIPIIFKL